MKSAHLHLEFAPRAHQTRSGVLLSFTLAVLIFAAAVLQLMGALAEHTRQSRELATLEAKARVAATPVKTARSDPAELARARLARQTSRQLAAAWADLLAALESAPRNVALLSIEPSATKRSLSLTAEAASVSEMVNYLRALQGDQRLANVTLVSHQLLLQAAGTPVRFQLRASWGERP
jgi:Tfp pilus assembly protein PilN